MSDATFANRHSVDIFWTKPQELPPPAISDEVEIITDPSHFTFTMKGIATPDAKQSEAYASTAALFYTFSTNPKEEKVNLRLPPVWRDLWNELSEARKAQVDAQDREVLRELRDLVRQRHDQELEDGVILQGAFRGRGAAKSLQDSGDDGSQDRSRQNGGNSEYFQKIWADKCATRKYQNMLVRIHIHEKYCSCANPWQESRMQLPMWQFRDQVLGAVDQNQVVIVCGETGW